jgi:putative intracellular protease/amidase
MKFWGVAFVLVGFLALQAHGDTKDDPARVLIVVSGYGLDGGKTRPGFEMDELSQAYLIFHDNGLSVDIASPAGGAVVADQFDPAKPYNQRFMADAAARAKLEATLSLASLRQENYQAVFIIGGKGAMFDLPVDTDLKAILSATYEADGVVSAVCHGPAAFMNVPLANGTSLLNGRAVTGFSNEEEALFGKGWASAFPILLEDGLRGAGASFSEAPMMLSHVVSDGRVVTGQNPSSTSGTAEAVLKAMGREPAPRAAFADERGLQLVAMIVDGEGAKARALLAVDPGSHDARLMAAWGYYRAQMPGADRSILTEAINVMEAAMPYYNAPEMTVAIADARSRLAALSPTASGKDN